MTEKNEKPDLSTVPFAYRVMIMEMFQSMQETVIAISGLLVPGTTPKIEDFNRVTDAINATNKLVREEIDSLRLEIDKARGTDGE